jgi:hypothetical protein
LPDDDKWFFQNEKDFADKVKPGAAGWRKIFKEKLQ